MSSTSQYISVRETSQLLGINESKIMEMIEADELKGYKIANQFLRLKKSEVMDLRNAGTVKSETTEFAYTAGERMKDFVYYNDFYLISLGIIAALLYIIFYT